MNDQQTKYLDELEGLRETFEAIHHAFAKAHGTMPAAAAQLAMEIARGLKVKDMDEDQAFYYKKFNLRIRSMVALSVTMNWTAREHERHESMAPMVGIPLHSDESESE